MSRRPPQAPSSSLSQVSNNAFAGVLHERTDRNVEEVDTSSDDEVVAPDDTQRRRSRGPRPSLLPPRRRRRSSCAPRLSLAARSNTTNANLSELYQKAIRLNAENKINAGNSWNLALIENMDKVVALDADAMDGSDGENNNNNRVNFAKASCTLDASVKIYGYRVDDVHLTSYKVLANLNRTDKKPSVATERGEPENDEVEEDVRETRGPKRTKNPSTGSTLESNHGT